MIRLVCAAKCRLALLHSPNDHHRLAKVNNKSFFFSTKIQSRHYKIEHDFIREKNLKLNFIIFQVK